MALGRPLHVDETTTKRTLGFYASVRVDVDLSKKIPDKIWVEPKKFGVALRQEGAAGKIPRLYNHKEGGRTPCRKVRILKTDLAQFKKTSDGNAAKGKDIMVEQAAMMDGDVGGQDTELVNEVSEVSNPKIYNRSTSTCGVVDRGGGGEEAHDVLKNTVTEVINSVLEPEKQGESAQLIVDFSQYSERQAAIDQVVAQISPNSQSSPANPELPIRK
ncbi:hypothetical protein IFM89_010961 [Coptis chinensis]|uniref:Uncharacterized protein n=1 Tax=Coptis chinensis TaxID=261450 RepID=A0A835IM25_9MAGN|nr:hypothetical protein IFM89_010961 [Coptis chinensis]